MPSCFTAGKLIRSEPASVPGFGMRIAPVAYFTHWSVVVI